MSPSSCFCFLGIGRGSCGESCQIGNLQSSPKFSAASEYYEAMTRGRGSNLFRKWRDYRGLTQEQVAERAQLPKSTVSKLETGSKQYTQAHLEALAHALDCTPADLIGRLPGAPNELTVLVNKVPPESVEAAVTVLKAIIKAA